MKRNTLAMVCASLLFVGTAQAQVWEGATGLENDTRHHPVTWTLGGYGYASTGSTFTEGATDDFFKYDPTTDTWETLDNFPGTARSYSIGGVYQGKGYLGFGASNSGVLNDLWVYDPDTEEWEELASCPCSGRQHPTFTVNEQYGKIYMGQGNNNTGNLDDWWEYDIATDTWTEKTDFPDTPRHHPYHFSIDGYSYTGLGHDNSAVMAKDELYRYDPSNDSWDQMATAPGPRIAGTQFDYNGQGFVMDGDGAHHQPSSPSIFWKYDPVTDSWEELEPHPGYSLWAPGSFIIDETLYFFGGYNKSNNTLFEGMWTTNLNDILNVHHFEEAPFSIYPNPAKDFLHIESTASLKNATLDIYSVDGKLLMQKPIEERINISALASGVYLLKYTNNTGSSKTVRFIKR